MGLKDKITVEVYVSKTIKALSIATSDAKGEKAVWRHAFGKPVCEDIKAWSLLIKDIPDELSGIEDSPSYAENAIYMAISAFAACGAQVDKISLGQAAAKLGDSSRGRFTRLERARTIDDLWNNLKPLLRLICSKKGSGLDYCLLAKELTKWQFDSLSTVRKWERDYYSANS